MASDRTDQLMDLLYGELSSEDEASLRAELEGDEELQDELAGYEGLLGQVRAALPMEEPPAGARASIMAAAKEAAERRGVEAVAEEARAERRPPERKAPLGIWGRISGSRGSQVALVAAVLLAGAFVFRFVDLTQNRMHGYDEVAMEPMPEMAAAPAAPAAPVEVAAQVEVEEEELMEAAAEAPADEALAQREEEAPARRRAGVRAEPKPEERAEKAVKMRKLDEDFEAPSAKPRPTRRSRSLVDRPPRDNGADAPAEAKELDMMLDTDIYGSREPAPAPRPEPSREEPPTAAKKADAPRPAAPAPVMGSAAEEAAEGAAAPTGGEAYRPTPGTIEAVADAYRRGDHRETVRQADRLLSSGEGTNTDRARAMQLKGLALVRLGRLQEADRVFASLQERYPAFEASQISEQRADIASQLDRNRAKEEPAAAPAVMDDF